MANTKMDHLIAADRGLAAVRTLEPAGSEIFSTKETDRIRSANLKIALKNLEGLHHHLCPRQVLGARIALFAGEYLDLKLPRADKRLFVFVETDGCALDGIALTTGTNVGKRSMRVMDYGKVAATFVDTQTNTAVRIAPNAGIRKIARNLAPDMPNRWSAQLEGYQIMPTRVLLTTQPVDLTLDIKKLISSPRVRVTCDKCSEEILNQRQVEHAGTVLCAACALDAYYVPISHTESEMLYSSA